MSPARQTVGLEISLKVALRQGPRTTSQLLAAVKDLGWRDVNLEAVRRTLVFHPELFDQEDELWLLTVDAERPAGSNPTHEAMPVPRQDSASVLLEPTPDELQIRGLPLDPRERSLFLETYRRVRAEQDIVRKVWVAGKGELYHWDGRCHLLWGGRAAARDRGQGNSWVREVTEHEAQQMQRDECSHCARGTGSTLRR